MELYTLIYPLLFYVTSLTISLPFAGYVRYYQARLISLLVLSLLTFILTYFMPISVPMLSTFAFWCYTVFIIMFYSSFYVENKLDRIDDTEIIFIAVFAFMIFLRFLFPDIYDCEKLMDSAFMNAVLVSNSLPPNDPFFAGKVIDFYYYFGHLIAACITLLSFSPPEIGYNITVAVLPAYTAMIIYGLLKEFVRPRLAVAGVLASIFSGDVYSAGEFFRRLILHRPINFGYYWNSTRVVYGTINEFPYFSFIHADMHAHVIAIPIKVLFLSVLYYLWKGEDRYLPLIPMLLFINFATNSWDYPLMFSLSLLLGISMLLSRDTRKSGAKIIIFTLLSVPFVFALFRSMNTPAAKTLLVAEKANPASFLLYAGFPVTLAYLYYLPERTGILIKSIPLSILVFPFCPVMSILLPLLVVSIYEAKKGDFNSIAILIGILAFVIPEFVAVESRTNTVFKFYLIGWLLFTIPPATKFEEYGRKARVLLYLILILSLIYPLAATPVRYSAREYTLDGMNYMKHFDGDYYAVKWIRERAGRSVLLRATVGVVMEAGHESYKYGGRVAAFTGDPAVIAWYNHEYFWRRNAKEVMDRYEDVVRFYTSNDCTLMRNIAKKYHVTFIFLGYEEKKVFKANESVFNACFKKVYEKDGTSVYMLKK